MLNGIQALNYGVADVAEAVRFLDDFGLIKVESSPTYALYRLPEGSYISVRHIDDPALPKSSQVGYGVREVIWGVDEQASLDRYIADLRRDHEITESEDGTYRFVTSFGQAMGLKVFNKLPIVSSPSPANAPGMTQRFNQWRKWRQRAQPKQIMHAVFGYPDVNEALDFFRSRLHFRVTDVQVGIGVYLRMPGSSMHHNIALMDADSPGSGANGQLAFHHTNLIVEDIDELMTAKWYMERQGWSSSPFGVGRHRIGSALFLYLPSPLGGEMEYGADVDALDDTWVPHVWGLQFGFQAFLHSPPPFLMNEPEWKLEFCDGATVRHTTFKELVASGKLKPLPAIDANQLEKEHH